MQPYLSYGIILRNCSAQNNKVVVFDKQQGKIDGFPSLRMQPKCLQGSLVSYRAEEWRNSYRLYDIELLALPESWVMQDILFLHHILELIAYFMQPSQRNYELFSWCNTLYQSVIYESKKLLFFKKFFLCRLFIVLGMYPELNAKQDETLFFLISGSVDIMLNDQYHELLDKKMSTWLYVCLQDHVGKSHLKTFDFLVKVKADETLYTVL